METDDGLKLSLKDNDGSLTFAFDRDRMLEIGLCLSLHSARSTPLGIMWQKTQQMHQPIPFSAWFVFAIPAGILPGWWDLHRLPEQIDEINVGRHFINSGQTFFLGYKRKLKQNLFQQTFASDASGGFFFGCAAQFLDSLDILLHQWGKDANEKAVDTE